MDALAGALEGRGAAFCSSLMSNWSGQCFLTATAAGVPCGVVSASPSSQYLAVLPGEIFARRSLYPPWRITSDRLRVRPGLGLPDQLQNAMHAAPTIRAMSRGLGAVA